MHPITAEIHKAIVEATEGLTEEHLRRHPEGKWDSASILEHLALTYGSTARVMDKCVREGHPLATTAKMRHRAAQLLVLGFNYIPWGEKGTRARFANGHGRQRGATAYFLQFGKDGRGFAQVRRTVRKQEEDR